MRLIKYNLLTLLISYLFRHQGAILREYFRSDKYQPNTLI